MSIRGFTIIELLITMAIIGVLATIFVGVNRSAQGKARDAQRKSDIKQYQGALENYANTNSTLYPGYAQNQDLVTMCATLLLPKCPDDPRVTQGGTPYKYRSGAVINTNKSTSYVLWATLENSKIFVVCSNGNVGEVAAGYTGGTSCPL